MAMTPDSLVAAVEGAGFTDETFGPAMAALAMLMQRQTLQSQLVALQAAAGSAQSQAQAAIEAKQTELAALQAQIDAALGGGA